MVRRTLGGLVIASALFSGACATKQVPQQSILAEAEGPPTITVQNDNWLDVVLYAVRGTARFRIGTVGGSSTKTFRLTSQALSSGNELRILADPIGAAAAYVTDGVVLAPGQRLELQIGSPLSISTFAIRNE